jgi:peptidoglycan hydrolase-like protein with peptidoglycan-binding domain
LHRWLPERSLPTARAKDFDGRMGQYHDEPSGDHPRLEEFDRGQWTQYAQERLKLHGYEPQDHLIDGYFGPMTKEAVRDFQGHWNRSTTGVIDEDIWGLLEGTEV